MASRFIAWMRQEPLVHVPFAIFCVLDVIAALTFIVGDLVLVSTDRVEAMPTFSLAMLSVLALSVAATFVCAMGLDRLLVKIGLKGVILDARAARRRRSNRTRFSNSTNTGPIDVKVSAAEPVEPKG
jgi:hypothetical protein